MTSITSPTSNHTFVDAPTQNWLDKTEGCRRDHINKIIGTVAIAIITAAAAAASLTFVLTVSPLATPLSVGIIMVSALCMAGSLVATTFTPFLIFADASNYRDPKNAKPIVNKFSNESLSQLCGETNWMEQYSRCQKASNGMVQYRVRPTSRIVSDDNIDTYASYGLIPANTSARIKAFFQSHQELRVQHWEQSKASNYLALIETTKAIDTLNAEWILFRDTHIRGHVPTI